MCLVQTTPETISFRDAILVTFALSGSIFGGGLILVSVLTEVVFPRRPDLWKKVPRNRIAGTIIGAACLVWSVALVTPLLRDAMPGLIKLLPLVAIAIGLMAVFYLDYLFTRSLGGLILLSSTHILREAFATQAPVRWLLSIICYLLSIGAMFMIATPWRFRDLLKKLSNETVWRRSVAGALLVMGLIAVIIAVCTKQSVPA